MGFRGLGFRGLGFSVYKCRVQGERLGFLELAFSIWDRAEFSVESVGCRVSDFGFSVSESLGLFGSVEGSFKGWFLSGFHKEIRA